MSARSTWLYFHRDSAENPVLQMRTRWCRRGRAPTFLPRAGPPGSVDRDTGVTAMPSKHVLSPERLRKVPSEFGFGWIDRRFLREGYLGRCDAHALALYLLLTIVADEKGLSFYGDATLARLLSMPPSEVARARTALIRAGVIAYRAPLYQLLSLDPPPPPRTPGVKPADTVLKGLQRQWRSGRGVA